MATTNNSNATETKTPGNYVLWTVTEKEGKTFWTRVGAVVVNSDGSQSTTIERMFHGRVVCRPA